MWSAVCRSIPPPVGIDEERKEEIKKGRKEGEEARSKPGLVESVFVSVSLLNCSVFSIHSFHLCSTVQCSTSTYIHTCTNKSRLNQRISQPPPLSK